MPIESRDYEEKRDFIRMTLDCALTLQDLGTGQAFTGRCVNLSATGALFRLDEAPALGTRMEIHIAPALAVVPALNAIVDVVRVLPAADGGYEVGTAIVEMRS